MQDGAPLSRGAVALVAPLPLCAANVESCSVLRPLPHFGQLTFSFFASTSFSYAVSHSSQMYS
jgi:hypothetical protein